MNDEEFIKEAREGAAAPIQNSFGADCLRETLDRLADANKRIEELEEFSQHERFLTECRTRDQLLLQLKDAEIEQLKASRLRCVKWLAELIPYPRHRQPLGQLAPTLSQVIATYPDCDEKRECEEILRDEK